MTTLILILILRPHDAIIINKDKQQSAMSEVRLSKVGCFLLKSNQVVLDTSLQLEVDLGSVVYQEWGRIGILKELPCLSIGQRSTGVITVLTRIDLLVHSRYYI